MTAPNRSCWPPRIGSRRSTTSDSKRSPRRPKRSRQTTPSSSTPTTPTPSPRPLPHQPTAPQDRPVGASPREGEAGVRQRRRRTTHPRRPRPATRRTHRLHERIHDSTKAAQPGHLHRDLPQPRPDPRRTQRTLRKHHRPRQARRRLRPPSRTAPQASAAILIRATGWTQWGTTGTGDHASRGLFPRGIRGLAASLRLSVSLMTHSLGHRQSRGDAPEHHSRRRKWTLCEQPAGRA